ncbi:hypothetical protein H2198_006579 [Neophaeococcomyces mojaviensis]|uniref:Uncharacterized protein n=1 Tax=Neophaeococcomyces mojaviensis TaxID=3383035 RepID=A0ACC3A2N2_9EURO|nr:hypothetical protein H2198_006579 [Knufia sp. JES_112]
MGSIEPAPSPRIRLPVFDISEPSERIAKQIVQAAHSYGFLYLDPNGTPLTEELVNREFELSKQFFSSPTSEKEHCKIGPDNRGWTGMHNEILDPAKQRKGDFKEAFNMGEFGDDGQPRQKMPKRLCEVSTLVHLYEFEKACRQTMHKLLDLIGLGLEIDGDDKWFSSRHGSPSGCTVRLLHYPALPEDTEYSPETDVRAGAHSDYGSVTLLFQRPGQPGLEIRPPDGSDTWSPVPPYPQGYDETSMPPILVNMGDLMSYWTNGLLRSTVHRVIFPKDTKGGRDRYSIAYFGHPSDETELVPVPSRLVREHSESTKEGKDEDQGSGSLAHGYGGGMTGERSITAKQHLLKRLNATYSHRMNKEEEVS